MAGVSPTHSYLTPLTYTATLTVVDNNGATGSAQTQVTITDPQPPQQTNAATFVSQSVPTGMIGGQNYNVAVTMKNTGTKTWTAANLHRLGSQNPQDNSTWGMSRASLPSSIAPNQNATFNFTVTAPATPGTYNFQWRMVQDNVEWFGEFTPNVEVNVAPPPPPNGEAPNLTMARLDPSNRTGEPGADLFSRNYNWSTSLVSLPGRAGLDLDLTLAYNTLVWTKLGTTIHYNLDNGFPGPGFRLGFPVIQGRFQNESAVKDAYLLITSSGKKVELRQTDQTNVFESMDSSYLRLEINNNLLLKTADGTQLSYLWINNEYKCTEVKDRNGNFITVNYDSLGQILSVTDTLGRIITFNYDQGTGLLHTITQTWTINGQPQVHTWASFEYVNLPIQTNFPGLTVNGPQNGQSIPVLWKARLADGSANHFSYNSWGQPTFVSRRAPDGHVLIVEKPFHSSEYNPPHTDCPRVTGSSLWVEDWIRSNWRNETHFTTDSSTGAQVATMEDGTVYKEYFASTGWQKGLLVRTENYATNESSPRKWTTTNWTQDNTLVNYLANPRPTETNIFDSDGNHRRSTVAYTPSGLPSDSYEFAADGTTVLRRSHTDYVTDTEYLNRHIIGLPSAQFLYGRDEASGTEKLFSKVDYQYDANGQYDLVAQGAPVQHDEVSYGLALVRGRGNLTRTRRFDVDFPNDESRATAQSIGYNTTGLPYFTRDPLGHQVTLRYEDWFSDNLQHNAMAYPTRVTDPDGFSSLTQYNFDFSGVTRKEGPPPAGHQQGAVQTTEYDLAGRVSKIRNEVNGAYTRYEYPATGKILNTFTTIRSASEEVYTVKIFDGAGRVRAVGGDLPNSVGRYWGQYFEYDIMGRVGKRSNPTETSATGPNWVATGDDDPNNGGNGWVYTQQSYDWKGRALVTTNPDGTTKEASYGGCGCAGGDVVTLTDEGTIDGGVAKRRQQKIYSDTLGRTVKTEVLNWQGGSVYSTIVNTYNVRDQVTRVRQYQGTDTSNVYQDTLMSYDGYGRLKTKHVPEQDANTATTYNYNSDDTVFSVVDARGAAQTFNYNARHLVTGVNYSAPSGITPTAPVSYAYDAAGNRTSMTDGLGGMSYQYDQLSRLTTETRTITGVGTYPLSYAYNLAGALTNITDSFGKQVGYNYDSAGRVVGVTGANFAGVSTYASNLQYRAWGALKHLDYGNSKTLDTGFNARLQPASFTVPGVMSKTYDYQADGSLKFSHDLLDAKFDRSYAHDHAGRITQALSGAEARNEGVTNLRPYKESFVYDPFGHLVERPLKLVWSGQGGNFQPSQQSYQNNRNVYWQYDANGNLVSGGNVQYTIDAAGRPSTVNSLTHIPYNGNPYSTIWGISADTTQGFDGDGQIIRKVVAETTHDNEQGDETTTATTTLIRSSVLGGKVVTEINSETGLRGFVYLGNEVLAWQMGELQSVKWEHRDPHNASFRLTWGNGSIVTSDKAELDPLGTNAGVADPTTVPSLQKLSLYPGWGDAIMRGDSQCMWDGLELPCDMHADAINSGYIHNANQQRGFNQLGAPTPFHPDYDYRGPGKRPNVFRFDNAAEYGDSVDAWSSPLWVGGGTVMDRARGQGHFAHAPQNPATDIDKTWSREFNCNRSANDLFRTLRRDFSKFASFAGPLAGGLGTAGIHFEKGPITEGRTIGITTGVISNVALPGTSVLPSETRQISVTVQNANTTSFTFRTNAGHVLYPGTISFAANDVGGGRVAASVTAKGNFADLKSQGFFEYLGGKEFENKVWNNFLDNLQRSCGSLK